MNTKLCRRFNKLSILLGLALVAGPASADLWMAGDSTMCDYKPRYSNKQALVRNYDWYVAHVNEFAGKSGVSHRVPWKQGLLAVAKWFF